MALNLPALFKETREDDPLKFGVVGWPLSHTLSPAMHTAAFKALEMNAVYKAIPVAPDEWNVFLTQAKSLPLEGFNITVPHKETILMKGNHPTSWDASRCAEMGAVNTVQVGPRGWVAHNTDVGGFQDDLRAQDIVLPGGTAVLLGSGGAARAAVSALAGSPRPPRRVWILNRTPAKAEELARDFSKWPIEIRGGDLAQGAAACREAALLVNATSLGLSPRDPSPVDPSWLHKGLVVYDMIYHRETALLAAARKAGARAVGGLGMLVHQGARSFEIWFNKKPPIAAMRKAAEDELKRRQ